MKALYAILATSLLFFTGCTKVEPTRTSGTDTIDNIVYMSSSYYSLGFSFSKAKRVSNLSTPKPDIVLYINKADTTLTFQADNLNASFYKLGDYNDAATAITAYENLKTVGSYQWEDMAYPIKDNQVWIYRTNDEHYAKIRIVDAVIDKSEIPIYGECTFQWVYQPDGSVNFPDK